jgi:hypothetical protein
LFAGFSEEAAGCALADMIDTDIDADRRFRLVPDAD